MLMKILGAKASTEREMETDATDVMKGWLY